jgi:hypothetical protein
LLINPSRSIVKHTFDTEAPPPPIPAPPEEVIDCLVEDRPGAAEPVRWSEYFPDGMLADILAQPVETDPEHREFEALERIGGWERVIAWAQARQIREMASFTRSAEARNRALGAYDSLVHESAVVEVGLMLGVSARTATSRVDDAWSLSTRLPGTLAALEQGHITLAKARILAAETMNLSDEHTAAVEQQALVNARQQTPGQLRTATRKAVLSTDPAAAQKRKARARRERGVQMWPEPDGMATLSCYLPAAEAVGVFAVLDEYARRARGTSDERTMDAHRADAWSIWYSGPPATAARAPARPAHAPTSRTIAQVSLATTYPPGTPPGSPPGSPAAGVSAVSAGAAAVRMSGSPFPTPRCAAATRSQASSLVMDQSLPPLLATSPQMAPGGAFSPIPSPASQSTMAPPGTGHPRT